MDGSFDICVSVLGTTMEFGYESRVCPRIGEFIFYQDGETVVELRVMQISHRIRRAVMSGGNLHHVAVDLTCDIRRETKTKTK